MYSQGKPSYLISENASHVANKFEFAVISLKDPIDNKIGCRKKRPFFNIDYLLADTKDKFIHQTSCDKLKYPEKPAKDAQGNSCYK